MAGKLNRVGRLERQLAIHETDLDIARKNKQQFLAAVFGLHLVEEFLPRKEDKTLEPIAALAGRKRLGAVTGTVPAGWAFAQRAARNMDSAFVHAVAEQVRHRHRKRGRELQQCCNRRDLQSTLDLREIALV